MQIYRSHQKVTRNGKIKYVLMKKVIVHTTTEKITVTKRYMHLWCMFRHYKCPSRNFGDISQLTNWILDSVATCHMTPEVLYFIPGSLEDTDKHIEVADKNHVIAKQKGQVRIKMCDDHRDPFIATSQNVLLAPDLCDRLFSIIKLNNSRYNCLLHKGFCTVYLWERDKNAATLTHSSQKCMFPLWTMC